MAADDRFRKHAVECLDQLYGFALALCRDRTAAEDLVQETYVRALAAERKASPEDNLRGWLFTILHNIWRNEQRRRRPYALEDSPAVVTALAAPDEDPHCTLDRKETRGRIRQALAALDEPFREVVVLRCLEGFSYREIADILGCPAGTVMSRLARARAQLRRSLAPAEAEEAP